MKHQESKLQRECIKWFRLQYPNHVLFAIPNGGYRSKIEAAIMKGEGVVSGVADLFLMCPNNTWNGFFIEIKSKTELLTKSQNDFRNKALDFRYRYDVCRSLDEFMWLVNNYLKIEEI